MGGSGAKSKRSGFTGGGGGGGTGVTPPGTGGTGGGGTGGGTPGTGGIGGGGIGTGGGPGVAPNPPGSKVGTGTGVGGTPNAQTRFERTNGKLEQSYKDVLETRYATGGRDAKRVYDKYIPAGGAVINGESTNNHYIPLANTIEMNFKQDNSRYLGRQRGSTWFHEHGHYVDRNAGGASKVSRDLRFYSCLANDIDAYEYITRKNMIELGFNPTIQDVRNAIRDELCTGINAGLSDGIQDIFGGVYRAYNPWSKIPSAKHSEMRWGHEWEAYWMRGTREYEVASEAWAHMFEAQFSDEKYNLMEQYFPTAFEWFNNKLNEI